MSLRNQEIYEALEAIAVYGDRLLQKCWRRSHGLHDHERFYFELKSEPLKGMVYRAWNQATPFICSCSYHKPPADDAVSLTHDEYRVALLHHS